MEKVANRENVLEGDILPNAILNAAIAGFDVDTIVQDVLETLETGEISAGMWEVTPGAIEDFVDSYQTKIQEIAARLRRYEYSDKPNVKLRGEGMVDGEAMEALQPSVSITEELGTDEGIDVESADEMGDDGLDLDDVDLGSEESTVRKLGVDELKFKALLKHQEAKGDGTYEGKVAIWFPDEIHTTGSHVASVFREHGLEADDVDGPLGEYVLDFISRNAGKYFGGISPDAARDTLKFTAVDWSSQNDKVLVATYTLGGGADDMGEGADDMGEGVADMGGAGGIDEM